PEGGARLARADVRIPRGGQGNGRAEGIERVARGGQRSKECHDVRAEPASLLEPGREFRLLQGGGQLAEPEKMRDIVEAHSGGKIADLVAAIVEPARCPVHAGYGQAPGAHTLDARRRG